MELLLSKRKPARIGNSRSDRNSTILSSSFPLSKSLRSEGGQHGHRPAVRIEGPESKADLIDGNLQRVGGSAAGSLPRGLRHFPGRGKQESGPRRGHAKNAVRLMEVAGRISAYPLACSSSAFPKETTL